MTRPWPCVAELVAAASAFAMGRHDRRFVVLNLHWRTTLVVPSKKVRGQEREKEREIIKKGKHKGVLRALLEDIVE